MAVTNRRIVLIAGPCTGTTLTTHLPTAATIYVNGGSYPITTTPTAHGDIAQWTGRTLQPDPTPRSGAGRRCWVGWLQWRAWVIRCWRGRRVRRVPCVSSAESASVAPAGA